MGYWNYRIVKQDAGLSVNNVGELVPSAIYLMAEVYYNDDGTPTGWCEACPHGEDVYELRQDYKMMKEALSKPILDESEIGGSNESETDRESSSGPDENVSGAPEDTKPNREREII